MPFDPISWGVGFVLTNAAKKGIESAFPPSLRKTLEKAIREWSSSVSESAYLDPNTLFSVVDPSSATEMDRPAQRCLQRRILELVIPIQQEWLDALMEQWRVIRGRHGEASQPFFLLNEEDARVHLGLLAQQIYRRCCQNLELATPHMLGALDRIEGKLITLDERLQVGALEALVVNYKPTVQSAKLVASAARKVAFAKGLSESWEFHLSRDNGITITLIFGLGVKGPVKGVLEINEDRLALWSRLDNDLLPAALAGAMFAIPLFSGVTDSWNTMVEFVGRTSRVLYPNSVRGGWFGISARFDLKRIGVPYPASCQFDKSDERVAMMKLGDIPELVPFLTFGEARSMNLSVLVRSKQRRALLDGFMPNGANLL